jgi:hemerythrin
MQVELTRLGNEPLDADHERLGRLVAELNAVYERGGLYEEAVIVIDALVAESRAHFHREEQEMERRAYPLLAAHREEHGNLLQAVQAIAAEFKANQKALDGTLLYELWRWVNHHITSSDSAFAEYLDLLPSPD